MKLSVSTKELSILRFIYNNRWNSHQGNRSKLIGVNKKKWEVSSYLCKHVSYETYSISWVCFLFTQRLFLRKHFHVAKFFWRFQKNIFPKMGAGSISSYDPWKLVKFFLLFSFTFQCSHFHSNSGNLSIFEHWLCKKKMRNIIQGLVWWSSIEMKLQIVTCYLITLCT